MPFFSCPHRCIKSECTNNKYCQYTGLPWVQKLLWENICISKWEIAIKFCCQAYAITSNIFCIFLFSYSIWVFCTMSITKVYQCFEFWCLTIIHQRYESTYYLNNFLHQVIMWTWISYWLVVYWTGEIKPHVQIRGLICLNKQN